MKIPVFTSFDTICQKAVYDMICLCL